MAHVITIPKALYADLRQHLASGAMEQVAFALAETEGDARTSLRIASLVVAPQSAFAYQSAFHVELTHEFHAQVIKQAFDRRATLVEFHSHRSRTRARFSGSDLVGFEEFVPHVRWRLQRRPYVAIVYHAGSFDALVWNDAADPEPLTELRVGSRRYVPTGVTLKTLHETYD